MCVFSYSFKLSAVCRICNMEMETIDACKVFLGNILWKEAIGSAEIDTGNNPNHIAVRFDSLKICTFVNSLYQN